MVTNTFLDAIEIAAFDARDSVRAGEPGTAFLHARDAAHYAHELMRELLASPSLFNSGSPSSPDYQHIAAR